VSVYGASKRAGEVELERRAERLPITILRPGIVFGEHDTKVAAMFQSIARFRLHVRMGFRDAPLSLIHATDLADLAVAAAHGGERLTTGAPGSGIYNACDDREHATYGALGRKIARALGRSVLVVPLPVTLAWPASLARQAPGGDGRQLGRLGRQGPRAARLRAGRAARRPPPPDGRLAAGPRRPVSPP
jgi:nucleoside-diphosphate-sugar epimerase